MKWALCFVSIAALAIAGDLTFEPNRGQTSPEARYLGRTSHGVIVFTDRELVLRREGELCLSLINDNQNAVWEPTGGITGETSYFVGRDPSRWIRNVPGYAKLVRRSVYPGIDAVYYGTAGKLEYDFEIAPHADASRIRWRVNGARGITIDPRGALVIETADGVVRQRKPLVYQTPKGGGDRRQVEGRFRRIRSNEFGFAIGSYDHRLPLTIDPVIESSTYLGGEGDDAIVAGDGKTLVGTTSSVAFPTAPFARRSGRDAFIRIVDAANFPLTYVFGGSGDDIVTGAILAPLNGYVVAYGYTNSIDLPTNLSYSSISSGVSNAWQPDYGGGLSDGFVVALPLPSSQAPPFLSYVGGPGEDRVTGGFLPNLYGSTPFLVGTTTQGGLPTPYFSGASTQIGPGGGTDGFILFADFVQSYPQVLNLTYFGGTGDDRPLAAILSGFSEMIITGESTSSDFPLMNSLQNQCNGKSDAFVMRFDITQTQPALLTSTLFGGSGSDRGTQLARSAKGTIVVGGVTTSNDLQASAGAQTTYGGGASDGFIAEFSTDLSSLISGTYIGGSGAEEVTSLAADEFGNVFAGGFTTSTDFPVKNAVQPTYGGGIDDGFLIHFDDAGVIQQATYLGGSGSDRIYGLQAPNDFSVWAVGQTSSTDFPTITSAAQTVLAGRSNGFVTRLSTALLGVGGTLASGLDLRIYTLITVGPLSGAVNADIVVTSSDPGSVLVAAELDSDGQAQVTLKGAFYAARQLYIDCLVDHGGADLTLTAPGYPAKVVHMDCYPVTLSVLSDGATARADGSLEASLWARQPVIAFDLGVKTPAAVTVPPHIAGLRPGGAALVVEVTSSNPQVVGITGSPVAFGTHGSSGGVVLNLLGLGDATLSFEVPAGMAAPSPLTVHVISPVRTATRPVAAGFACSLGLGLIGSRPLTSQGPITITSLNPETLLLATASTGPFSASLTITGFPVIFGSSVGPTGDAAVMVSVPGLDPVTVTVHVTTPLAYISAAAPGSNHLVQGGSGSVNIGVIANPGGSTCYLSPGANPVSFSITNSNPDAVTAPASVVFLPETYFVSVHLDGAGDGAATLSLIAPDGFALNPGSESVTVTSRAKPFQVPDAEVGKDLVTQVAVRLPYPAPADTTFTIGSSDPNLVALSTTGLTAGQAQINVDLRKGGSAISFYVIGLSNTGRAIVTVEAAPYGKAESKIQLDPSGWAWTSTTVLTYPLHPSTYYTVRNGTYALDPVTLIPVSKQNLRLGLTPPAIQFDNTNPDVLGTNPTSGNSVQLFPRAAGTGSLVLKPVDGFTTPSKGQEFLVKVLPDS